MFVFVAGGKPEYPQKTFTNMEHQAGIEPMPHWWKASALTTPCGRLTHLKKPKPNCCNLAVSRDVILQNRSTVNFEQTTLSYHYPCYLSTLSRALYLVRVGQASSRQLENEWNSPGCIYQLLNQCALDRCE